MKYNSIMIFSMMVLVLCFTGCFGKKKISLDADIDFEMSSSENVTSIIKSNNGAKTPIAKTPVSKTSVSKTRVVTKK